MAESDAAQEPTLIQIYHRQLYEAFAISQQAVENTRKERMAK